ncbi:hypothetical protein MMPV_000382 [Pyropia vietnamensis]
MAVTTTAAATTTKAPPPPFLTTRTTAVAPPRPPPPPPPPLPPLSLTDLTFDLLEAVLLALPPRALAAAAATCTRLAAVLSPTNSITWGLLLRAHFGVCPPGPSAVANPTAATAVAVTIADAATPYADTAGDAATAVATDPNPDVMDAAAARSPPLPCPAWRLYSHHAALAGTAVLGARPTTAGALTRWSPGVGARFNAYDRGVGVHLLGSGAPRPSWTATFVLPPAPLGGEEAAVPATGVLLTLRHGVRVAGSEALGLGGPRALVRLSVNGVPLAGTGGGEGLAGNGPPPGGTGGGPPAAAGSPAFPAPTGDDDSGSGSGGGGGGGGGGGTAAPPAALDAVATTAVAATAAATAAATGAAAMDAWRVSRGAWASLACSTGAPAHAYSPQSYVDEPFVIPAAALMPGINVLQATLRLDHGGAYYCVAGVRVAAATPVTVADAMEQLQAQLREG